MGELKSHALVLRTRDYREADRLVTFLTREEGKVTAVAKGVRKTKSKLSALVEPLTLGFFLLHRGKSLDTLIQGEIVKPYRKLRENLLLFAYGQYFCELCEAALPEREPSLPVFLLVLTALEALESDSQPSRVARCFELNLLETLGYRPDMENCQHCGSSIGPFHFDFINDGLVCKNCPTPGESRLLSGAATAVMRRFLNNGFHRLSVCSVPSALNHEIAHINAELLKKALGKSRFKSMDFLQIIEEEGY